MVFKIDETSEAPNVSNTSAKPTEPTIRVSARPNKGQRTTGPHAAHLAKRTDDDEPDSYEAAITHPTHGKQWEQATKEEYDSIVKSGTWELVPRPADRDTVSCKWVFKAKKNEEGTIVRFKARLVARGFTQVYGVDYMDTFAPVAKMASLRILLAIAAFEDLEIHQMDVVTAFLAGKLDVEVYMEQPEGYKQRGNKDLVCKLLNSLYGVKQSARVWNQRLRKYLKRIGFKQLESDHCVYINSTGVIIAIWVDDLIIFSKDPTAMNTIKQQLRDEFEMKDQGELRYFLGILVHRDRARRIIRIDQKGYIEMILKRFNMENSNPVSTPMATGTKLLKATTEDEIIPAKGYQSLVGSQMYAMLCTRPDLGFAIPQRSQFGANPTSTHEAVAKRIMRYLNGTMDLGITYDGSTESTNKSTDNSESERSELVLEGYSDADFPAGEDRKSFSGCVHARKRHCLVEFKETTHGRPFNYGSGVHRPRTSGKRVNLDPTASR
jgi:hypothetical protein